MSSSSASTVDRLSRRSRGRCWGGCARNANWSGINIAAMVVGFVLFWPIGLFILFWIIAGREVRDLPQWISEKWSRALDMWNGKERKSRDERSDNVVFEEFQQTQYDRIREIKAEIKERSRRFADFRANAKRRADEDEFNRFMAQAPGRAEI
ncbi:MAG: DUF2852 domain-containing protein [Pseudomonadota bacterium]